MVISLIPPNKNIIKNTPIYLAARLLLLLLLLLTLILILIKTILNTHILYFGHNINSFLLIPISVYNKLYIFSQNNILNIYNFLILYRRYRIGGVISPILHQLMAILFKISNIIYGRNPIINSILFGNIIIYILSRK